MPTILYADDDPQQHLLVRTALRKTGYLLIEADDGIDALEKIQQYHPDLILLDLFMPRLDGFRVLETLKSAPDLRHIPVVVLSAWPTGDNRKRTRLAGAADFISKPYLPSELVERIDRILNNQTALTPFKKNTDTSPL